jgi:signal transduction histidine kinase
LDVNRTDAPPSEHTHGGRSGLHGAQGLKPVRVVRAVLVGPFSRRAWLDTMHVFTGGLVAFITFWVMAFLAAVAIVVAPTVVLVAVPFAALLACMSLFTMWQRSRFQAFLTVHIPPAPEPPSGSTFTRDLIAAARSRYTWRQIAYHLAVAPVVALAEAAAVALAWSASLFLIAVPLLNKASNGTTRVGALPHMDKSTAVAFGLSGIVLLFTTPWVARACAMIDETIGRAMLGPTRSEELARHVTSLTESRAGAVDAADTERRRLERDLHDGTQQRLVSMAMNLGLARATLTDVPEEAREVIVRAHEEAKEALKELRDLVQGLHPAILNDRGLDAALSGIAARAPLPVRLTVTDPDRKYPATMEAVAFFVVSEALANVAKHSHATEAEVIVDATGDSLRVAITDNGLGGADPDGGTGLRGLAQRVASVDGRLRMSSPTGGPTVIIAELPNSEQFSTDQSSLKRGEPEPPRAEPPRAAPPRNAPTAPPPAAPPPAAPSAGDPA